MRQTSPAQMASATGRHTGRLGVGKTLRGRETRASMAMAALRKTRSRATRDAFGMDVLEWWASEEGRARATGGWRNRRAKPRKPSSATSDVVSPSRPPEASDEAALSPPADFAAMRPGSVFVNTSRAGSGRSPVRFAGGAEQWPGVPAWRPLDVFDSGAPDGSRMIRSDLASERHRDAAYRLRDRG